ncbi:RHS repeat domain-containing protein, partial [Photobacterium kishitanii]|uniref:RHS repeat domain-containing protein n=1 Tax=Photobacterium kishitanii TaxID=318456 RepID=UPI000D4BCE59
INGSHYIKGVIHPTGFSETIYYKKDAIKLPKGSSIAFLPGVSEHKVIADGQVFSTTYEYTNKNYLGYGLSSYNKGFDTLYETKEMYEYGCKITTNEKIREVTYNKYHLLIRKTEKDKNSRSNILNVTTEYHLVENQDFEHQPNQFLNPKKKTTTHYSQDGMSREEVEISEFDTYGNISREVDRYGIEKSYTYYMQSELPINDDYTPHLVKRIDVYPSQRYSTVEDYSYSTDYEYSVFQGIDSREFLLKSREYQKANDGTLIKDNTFSYYLDKNDSQTFSLLKQTNSSLSNKTVERVEYKFSSKNITVTKYATYFDGTTAQQSETFCRHSGKIVATKDITNITIHSSYDLLGRLTSEIHDKDTKYEFIIDYVYNVEERSMETYRGGVLFEKTIYDNKGRKKQTFKIDTDSTLNKSEEYSYDEYDRVIKSKLFNYRNAHETSYTITKEYDVWGKTVEIAENGLRTITLVNNVDQSTTTYHEYNENIYDRNIEYKNELGKTTNVVINGQSWSKSYDGFGNLVKEICPQGVEKIYKINQYGYEFEQQININGETIYITSEYDIRFRENGHQEIINLCVNGHQISSRRYDGLGRVIYENISDIEKSFRYNTLSNIPNDIVTGTGTVSNTIDERINLIIQDSSDNSLDVNVFIYDNKTKLLLEERNNNITNHISYYPNRKVKSEIQHGKTMVYEYSSNGLLTRSIDYQGKEEARYYDDHNHLIGIRSSDYDVDITRDFMFRVEVEKIISKISSDVIINRYTYSDDFARKVNCKEISVNGNLYNTQIYSYNKFGLMVEKKITDNLGEVFIESFEYNVIGQLAKSSYSNNCKIDYLNIGYIKNQIYSYDFLNNISRVDTLFRDYENYEHKDVAEYSYDSFKLSFISHSNNDISSEHFIYDKNGNMSVRSDGCRMHYTANNLLTKLSDKNGGVLIEYIYSATGRLSKQILGNQGDISLYYSQAVLCGEYQSDYYSKNILVNGIKFGRCVYNSDEKDLDIFVRDYKNSVIGVVNKTQSNQIQYSAYGHSLMN